MIGCASAAATTVGLIVILIALPLAASRRSSEGNNNIPEWTEEAESSGHHAPSAALLNGILACQSDPCFHGLCIDHTNSSTYSCFCEDGYTGYQCQTNWNECWNAPCHHGGTCVDGIGRYHCLCRPGFTGDDCQVNIDECQSDPCQNGATCQDGENGYRCRCAPGYEGAFCQIDVSVCRHHHNNDTGHAHDGLPPTCRHGARCVEGPGLDYYCICPEGWTGKHCETDVDECCSNPCKNNGQCIDQIGSYQCACSYGFTGKDCETALERCDDSLCGYQGICWVQGDGQIVCFCQPDFHGVHCEYQYNECLLPGTKCLNGGRCIDQVDGFSCSCPSLWTGSRCQTYNNRTESGEQDGTSLTATASTTTLSTTNQPAAGEMITTTTLSRVPGTTTTRVNKTTPRHRVSTASVGMTTLTVAGAKQTDPTMTTFASVDVTSISAANVSTVLTATPPAEDSGGAISTTMAAEGMTTTFSSNEAQTTLANELTTVSTTSFDDTTTAPWTAGMPVTVASATLASSDVGTTPEGVTLRTTIKSNMTTPFDPLLLTKVVPVPEPRPAENRTRSEEREIDSVSVGPTAVPATTSKSITRPTKFATTSKRTRPTTVSTSSSHHSTSSSRSVTLGLMPQPTEGQPIDDSLLAVTSEPSPDASDEYFYETQTQSFPEDVSEISDPSDATTPVTRSPDYPLVTQPHNASISTRRPDPPKVTSSVPGQTTTRRQMTPSGRATPRSRTTVSSHLIPTTASRTPPHSPTHTMMPSWPEFSTTKTGQWEPTAAPTSCSSDICMNGGTCVLTPEGWQCRCTWRNEGRRCELEKKLRVPQFHGNSYLSYVVPDRMLDEQQQNLQQVLEARLEFSTSAPLGLIAYIHSNDAQVYLAVYVERQALKFRLSCGRQQMTLVETKYNVSDGAIHSIFIRFLKVEERNSTSSFCMGSVKLNNSYSMNGEQRLADDEQFSWPGRLHIGGRPSGTPTPAEIIFLPGLVGCAYSLEIDGQRLDMSKDAVQGKALDECPDRRANCGGLRCLNGGICSTDGEQRCICPMGWVGDQCEIRQCPCNPCQGNSTCLMSPNDQMICVCNYGRIGSLCEIAVNVTRPHFDGTILGHSSYLSLIPPSFIRDHFELKFSFVTDDARQVALLLFIGQQIDAEDKDFLAVSFIRGHVALTWDLGSGTRRIFTARPVAISTMGGHSVHVGRRGRVAWLQVNNQPTVTGRSPGLMSVLNAHPFIFLGGHSSFNHTLLPSDLPLHSGFRGCIYDLVFRSRDQDFNAHWLPPIHSGRGVRQCSIPACRLRMRPDNVTWHGGNDVEDDANRPEDDVC